MLLSSFCRKLQEKIESVIDIENFEGQLQQQSGSADHDIHFIDAHEGQLYGRVKFDLLRPEFDQVSTFSLFPASISLHRAMSSGSYQYLTQLCLLTDSYSSALFCSAVSF